MTTSKVVQVYQCGHADIEHLEGVNGPAFVFVEGACSASECASTDLGWFHECSSPSTDDLAMLKDLVSQFRINKAMLTSILAVFDGLSPKLAKQISGNVNNVETARIVDFLVAGEREELIEQYFAPSQALLNYAKGFTRKTQRPFFDYCFRQASREIADATVEVQNLRDSLRKLALQAWLKPKICASLTIVSKKYLKGTARLSRPRGMPVRV